MYFLRHLDEITAGRASGSVGASPEVTRREILKLTTLAGGGLTLAIVMPS